MFVDFLESATSIVDIAMMFIQLGFFQFLIEGGWITIIRAISFFLDSMIISFISTFFDYFSRIITGTLIIPETVDNITKNLYFFIALILLFKLGAFILKYIMNPDMVYDENVGVHALVKRVIIGMVMLVFIPTIFNLARDFQSAILEDQIIEKVIMDQPTLLKYNQITSKAPIGRIIGFSVFQGFWSYDNTKFGSSLVNNQYKKAIDRFDPSGIMINSGGRVGYITNYYYDYFPILSTVALGYTLYIIIKMCFDVLVRSFNLTILQVISPLTVSDYMISGDKQGTFANWLKTTLGCYLMLFIRVLSLWFLVFVTMQMQMTNSECVTNLVSQGVSSSEATTSCGSSLLFLNDNGDPDMLLRAMIIIALLAFIMDLPKLFSKIFGLDLEQESSVTGMISKVGGVLKMAGLGVVGMGGAALGGAYSSAKALAGGAKQKKQLQAQFNRGDITKAEYNKGLQDIKNNTHAQMSHGFAGATRGMFMSMASMVPGGKEVSSEVVSGFKSSTDAASQEKSKQKQDAAQQQEQEYRSKILENQGKSIEEQRNINLKLGVNENIDSVETVAKADALGSLYEPSDTVIGNLQAGNRTLEAVRDNTVHIKDNTKVISDNTSTLVDQGSDIVDKLDLQGQTLDAVRDNTVHIKDNTKVISDNTSTLVDQGSDIIDKLDLQGQTLDAVRDNTVHIKDNTKVISDNTGMMTEQGSDIIDRLDLQGQTLDAVRDNTVHIKDNIKSIDDKLME